MLQSTVRRLKFIASRLWHFQNLYFLKPHDAVNDTLTAGILSKLDWNGPVVELGSGDGVFSYVMHGDLFQVHMIGIYLLI